MLHFLTNWGGLTVETIRFLDLKELFARNREEYLAAMARVLDEAELIGGEELRNFELRFAEWVGPDLAAVGCGNGTDAITIATKSLELPADCEAIIPAMTYAATAGALVNAGLRLKLVDVEPRTGLIDVAQIEKAITPRTKLIAPVHLYGQMAAMDEIRAIADRRGLKILEDAAQAHGASWRGQSVGHWGDAATFSFYPGKNLGGFGDGGAIVSRDAKFLRRCRALGNQGGLAKYEHDIVGMNSRLDNLQAAILNVRLAYIDRWNTRRREIAAMYAEALRNVPGIETPFAKPDARHAYHLYVVLCDDRDALRVRLATAGIETGLHYPRAIHQLPAFRSSETFPHAERFARDGLSLPIGPTLTDAEVVRIVEAIRS